MGKPKNINAEKWLEEHGDYLFRYAIVRVNDTALAEDLVQDTFLSALKAYDRFDHRSSERTWFVSILKNKIIDHYRKASRKEVKFDFDAETDPSQDFEQNGFWKLDRAPSEWHEDPEQALEQKDFLRILRKCLELLPSRLAHIFILRQMDGMESKEICKELEITPSNLWVMLHRARSQLRRCLDKNWFGSKKKDE